MKDPGSQHEPSQTVKHDSGLNYICQKIRKSNWKWFICSSCLVDVLAILFSCLLNLVLCNKHTWCCVLPGSLEVSVATRNCWHGETEMKRHGRKTRSPGGRCEWKSCSTPTPFLSRWRLRSASHVNVRAYRKAQASNKQHFWLANRCRNHVCVI